MQATCIISHYPRAHFKSPEKNGEVIVSLLYLHIQNIIPSAHHQCKIFNEVFHIEWQYLNFLLKVFTAGTVHPIAKHFLRSNINYSERRAVTVKQCKIKHSFFLGH